MKSKESAIEVNLYKEEKWKFQKKKNRSFRDNKDTIINSHEVNEMSIGRLKSMSKENASRDNNVPSENPVKKIIYIKKKKIDQWSSYVQEWHSIYTLNKFQFTFSGSVKEFKFHWNFIYDFII